MISKKTKIKIFEEYDFDKSVIKQRGNLRDAVQSDLT